jgi:uncharacterized protein with HEPN domain
MTTRKPKVYLLDILESINLIESFIDNVDEDSFFSNVEKQDAVLRRLEIIGEAVKHLPDSIRIKYPTTPWRQIAGMRDIIIHEYFGITLDMIWVVITEDLPELKSVIQKIIAEEPD